MCGLFCSECRKSLIICICDDADEFFASFLTLEELLALQGLEEAEEAEAVE